MLKYDSSGNPTPKKPLSNIHSHQPDKANANTPRPKLMTRRRALGLFMKTGVAITFAGGLLPGMTSTAFAASKTGSTSGSQSQSGSASGSKSQSGSKSGSQSNSGSKSGSQSQSGGGNGGGNNPTPPQPPAPTPPAPTPPPLF